MDMQPQTMKVCANCGCEIDRFEHVMTKMLNAEFHEVISSPVRVIDGIGEVCQRCHKEHET